MMPSPPCASPCAAVSARVHGSLICDVADYEYSWGNKICDGILPLCVLRPKNASDIAAAIKVAATTNTSLSYRSGGHSYTCNGIKANSIHIDLRSLNAVELRPSSHYNGTEISFGSGLIMRQILDALKPGQTIVHGQCPTVGAGGLFLHGGIHTTLSLRYGSGNETVTEMEVVTASGEVLTLSGASPHQDLWRAMRQAGSSFAIATRIAAKVFELPPSQPRSDGGDFFALEMPRRQLLDLLDRAAYEAPGLPNYIHVNGVDFLIASASTDFGANARWVEGLLGRKLSTREWMRSKLVATFQGPVSRAAGGADKRFGSSGEVPYLLSSQEAFATISFEMPIECFQTEKMKALLTSVPDYRDNATDLGCYYQVSTTYGKDFAYVEYNCAYDSAYYREKQRQLNTDVLRLCPSGMRRYYNTPSEFLTPRDYFPNYDDLAAIKSKWDPHEVFRVYQGVRPTGQPPDAYQFTRPYVRKTSAKEWLAKKSWDAMKAWGLLRA